MRTPDCFSPDGQRIVLASDDFAARVWDAASGKPVGEPIQHRGAVTAAGFSPDGKRVFTASLDGTLRFGDGASGKGLGDPLKHPKGVLGAGLGAAGNLALTWCQDFQARLWTVATAAALGRPMAHDAVIRRACFGAEGKLVLTASDDRTARLWDARSGEPVGEPLKHPGAVRAAGFGIGDSVVWTLGDDGLVRLWAARTQKQIGSPLGHDGVLAVDLHPKGKLLVTGGNDKFVRLWDAESGRPIAEPLPHDSAVLDLRVGGAEGKLLVTAEEGGSARLWSLDSFKQLADPLRHKAPVVEAGFDASGERVLTIAADHIVRLWESPAGRLIGQPIPLGSDAAPQVNQATTALGNLALVQVGTQSVVTVAGITGVFTPLTSGAGKPLGADERENLLSLVDQLKREVSEVQSRNLKLEADLATLRERPSAADDFAGGVQQSLDELQQRMANMRNSTSNFAVREFKLEASVFVQVTPLGTVEYRFVQPGEQAPAQALSKLSLQVVPVPKDNLAGVWTPILFQPDAPVATLPGLGDDGARRMEAAGVFTLGEFLQVGTRARAQAYLSALLDVERQRVALWAQQALLMTLRGVTGNAALVLIEAGVSRFETLAGLAAEGLTALYEATRQRRPDLAAPPLDTALASQWVRAARQYLGLSEPEPGPEPPAAPT